MKLVAKIVLICRPDQRYTGTNLYLMSARNNKSPRKPNDRRNREEGRPTLPPKSNRTKRWKDMYESGALSEDDPIQDDDLFSSDEDKDEDA